MPLGFSAVRRALHGFFATLMGLAALTVFAATKEVRPTDLLSPPEQTAMGLLKLSPAQLKVLNTQIQNDIAIAQKGDAACFSGTFTQRRTAAERKVAGLDLLGVGELEHLDSFVARILPRPAVAAAPPFTFQGESIDIASHRPELHGEISVFAGGGSGGCRFYGSSFTGIIDDPDHGLTVGVNYTEVHGK
jgi:hypothetical protein